MHSSQQKLNLSCMAKIISVVVVSLLSIHWEPFHQETVYQGLIIGRLITGNLLTAKTIHRAVVQWNTNNRFSCDCYLQSRR